MSRRGEIVIECDMKDCHAEQIFGAGAVWDCDVDSMAYDVGWREKNGKDVCPQCVEEGKA